MIQSLEDKSKRELIEIIKIQIAEFQDLDEQLTTLNNEYLILYKLAAEIWPSTKRPLEIVLSERTNQHHYR